MLQWFAREAPVARKIQIGYGLIVGGVAIGAGILAHDTTITQEKVTEYRAAARTNAATSRAAVDIMAMRVDARDISNALKDGQMGRVEEARALMETNRKSAHALLDKAIEAAPISEWKQRLTDIKPLVDEYAKLASSAATEEQIRRRHEVAQEVFKAVNDLGADVQARQDELGPEMMGLMQNTVLASLVMLFAVLLIGTGLSFLLTRLIAAPLKGATTSLQRLASGDLTVQVEGADRKDDAGDLARALQVFKDNALEMKRLEKLAEDERIKAEHEKRAAMNAMADDFERKVFSVVDAVAAASTELEASAGSLTRTATESATRADQVSRAADLSAANVQTVASAAEEMSASASEIAQQVSQANDVAKTAESRARDADQTVRQLAEAAQKIGDVVNLITEIASQTNLLALNATIEAARAGEAGRGFAVVAAEVKRLAEQTAKATEDIASQVNDIQGATEGAVHALDAISLTIGEVSRISMSISAAVEEQTAAIREISRNTTEVADGTREVGSSIIVVREAASETGAAADQCLSAAQELGLQSNRLRDEMRRFVEQVRVA